jgi:GTP-binding protein
VGDLLEAIVARLELPPAPPAPEDLDEAEEVTEAERPRGDVRLAVVGRPNVGKSTFVNALLGEERLVVSEVPGTTRDAIDSVVEHRGRRFIVTDTAGIRRKRSIAQKVEAYSVVRAMRAIDEAEVVACLLDATEAGVEQDARLLGIVLEKGKALVVVVNKWDVAEREGATQDWYRRSSGSGCPSSPSRRWCSCRRRSAGASPGCSTGRRSWSSSTGRASRRPSSTSCSRPSRTSTRRRSPRATG